MACRCEDCDAHLEQLRCSQLATEHTRDRLVSLAREHKHQTICNKHARVLLLQRSLWLLRDECEKKRRQLAEVKEEVELLKRANERREERLKRAKERDFTRKIQSAKREYSRKQALAHNAEDELVALRRLLIRRVVEWVFPISIEQSVNGNSDVSTEEQGSEEEDDWVLSGVSSPCITPLGHICHGFLPANGDMTGYIDLVKKKKKEPQKLQDCHDDVIPSQHSHLYTSVPAAMTCVVHCVTLLSSLLDRPLPYPIFLPLALCEYGKIERRPRAILTSLNKLNDNVVYLCFTQLVPIERLAVGRVLDNLLSLVHHENLGRCGPYTCHSHLLQHTSSAPRSPRETSSVHDWDNTPPLLHSADEDGLMQQSLSFSTDEEEELVGDCDESSIEEWEEVEDINRVPYLGLGDRLEYGQVYGDYSSGRGHHSQWREEESTVQSSSAGLLEALGSLLGSGFRN